MFEPKTKSLLARLFRIDALLTGKSWEDLCHTAAQYKDVTLYDFIMDRMYYLSDGGYSRLYWADEENGYLCLASESRDEVKEAWDKFPTLIKDLNKFVCEKVKDKENLEKTLNEIL